MCEYRIEWGTGIFFRDMLICGTAAHMPLCAAHCCVDWPIKTLSNRCVRAINECLGGGLNRKSNCGPQPPTQILLLWSSGAAAPSDAAVWFLEWTFDTQKRALLSVRVWPEMRMDGKQRGGDPWTGNPRHCALVRASCSFIAYTPHYCALLECSFVCRRAVDRAKKWIWQRS